MAQSKTLMEKTKRMRVRGTGPKREELLTFKKLGDISPDVIDELNSIIDSNKDRNDINGDNYQISNTLDCQGVFGHGENYRQILMQERVDETLEKVNEYAYSHWAFDVKVKEELKKYFNNVYRFRMSEMKGGSSINWHIDSCTSVMCRAQICLNENDSIFEFKTRGGEIHSFTMKPGELWFINTGWNHRVVSGSMTRRVAIFGCHFDDIVEKKGILK